MKIAIISRFSKEVKEATPSGASLFTYLLAEGLAKKSSIDSIEVYGVGKSYFQNPKIKFNSLLEKTPDDFIATDKVMSNLKNYHIHQIKEDIMFNLYLKTVKDIEKKDYDIVHDTSTSPVFISLSEDLKTHLVVTLQTSVLAETILIPYRIGLIDEIENNPYFVAISNSQKQLAAKNNIALNIREVIYNGLDINKFFFHEDTNSSSGIWIGRISKSDDKGLKQALVISDELGLTLKVVAVINDQHYFENEIEPMLTKNVQFLDGANITLEQKSDLYGNSLFMLYPLEWEEPFGFVFLESLACGTPVICFARGAAPEIIEDGKTGFLVNPADTDIRGEWIIKKTGLEGLKEAIGRIQNMPKIEYLKMRQACRERVKNDFTIEKMIDQYEEVYKNFLTT